MTEVKLNFNYIPLSFMSADEEIKRQIKNTVIMQYVLNKFKNPVKLVEQLVDTRYGYTDSSKEEGTHKFLRITDIKDGKVDWDSVPFCDCLNPNGYLLENGDILVARTGGTTGKSFLVSETESPSVFASYLIRLRTSKSLKPEFLNLFLNSFVYWNQITDLKQGSAQPNVNAEKLKGLIIPYCDIEMQENLLQLADSMYQNKDPHPQLIEIFENVKFIINKFEEIEKLKVLFDNQKLHASSLRQSILKEAVQGKLVPQDPDDEPASVLLEKIKVEKEQLIKEKKIKKEKPLPPITEDEIPYELPQGWEWVRLGTIFRITTGKTPSTSNKKFWNGSIPWISPKDMKSNLLIRSEDAVTPEAIEENSMNLLLPGTVLVVVRSGILRRTIPVSIINMSSTINQDIKSFDSGIPFLNQYLAWYIRGYEKSLISKYVQTGTTVERIIFNEFVNQIIPIPPYNQVSKILKKINEMMTICDELETTVQKSKMESELLMKSVLQEAFNSTKKDDNVIDFPGVIHNDIEDWEIAARSDGEIDSDTKTKIKNRVTTLLGKSRQ
ncbi:restriction endonuclease subunit S [Paenibacillus amylolyticus]|nr:restriction endonuclease subunit S [Paenibacillus amylolyticus]